MISQTELEQSLRRLAADVPARPDFADAVMQRLDGPMRLRPARRRLWRALAAAAVVGLAVVGGTWVRWPRGDSSVALAEVVQKVRQAQTVSDRMTERVGGREMAFREFIKEPNLRRSESDHGQTLIYDATAGKALYLDSKTMTAVISSLKVAKDSDVTGHVFADDMRATIAGFEQGPYQRLGKEVVEGVPTEKFRFTRPGGVYEMWVDPKTQLPVQTQSKIYVPATLLPPYEHAPGSPPPAELLSTDISKQIILCTRRNIAFDVPLDDSLFEMKAPQGYSMRQGGSTRIEVDPSYPRSPGTSAPGTEP